MNNNFLIISLIFMIVIFSCSEDLMERIRTNNILPEVTKPEVKSFEKMDTIIIEWEKDEGADEYILYRSEEPDSGYNKIYSGTELSYEDNIDSYEKGTFFYYKLTKKRESKEFEKSDYAYGVAASIMKDVHENNDEENNAKCIDNLNSLSGNIYYYGDQYGNVLYDTDWYSINVNQGLYNNYIFYIESSGSIYINNLLNLVSSYSQSKIQDLSHTAPFNIYNRLSSKKKLTFNISFNMINSHSLISIMNNTTNNYDPYIKKGMIVIVYTIKYNTTEQIPSQPPQ